MLTDRAKDIYCVKSKKCLFRCEEVESRDEETQRKKIEEKLSQAMIRNTAQNNIIFSLFFSALGLHGINCLKHFIYRGKCGAIVFHLLKTSLI